MATKKKAPPPPVEAVPCVNCSTPAVWITTNPGALKAGYCEACGQNTYPHGEGLERI